MIINDRYNFVPDTEVYSASTTYIQSMGGALSKRDGVPAFPLVAVQFKAKW